MDAGTKLTKAAAGKAVAAKAKIKTAGVQVCYPRKGFNSIEQNAGAGCFGSSARGCHSILVGLAH